MKEIIGFFVAVGLLFMIIMLFTSLVVPQKTLKWAKVDLRTRRHGFFFYALLTLFLFFTFGIVTGFSLGAFVIWAIILLGALVYAAYLCNREKECLDTEGYNEQQIRQQPELEPKIIFSKPEEPQKEVVVVRNNPLEIKKKQKGEKQKKEPLFIRNIHNDEEQQLRQRNARLCEIVSIDKKQEIGFFKGSAKEPYTTSPESCTCRDFLLRKLPCKHMYRLMHELGKFDLNKTKEGRVSEISYDRSGFNFSVIEKLSEEAQKELFGLVREWIASKSRNEWLYERNNPIVRELILHGFLEEFDNPSLILSYFSIQNLRVLVQNNKNIDKRKRETVIDGILELRPDFINEQKKLFMPIRFCGSQRSFRGQIRGYLKNKFPDEMELIYGWGPNIEISALATYS